MKNFVLSLLSMSVIVVLSACSTASQLYTSETSPKLFEMLESGPNGAKGDLEDGSLFLIERTRAKSNLLCRDAQIVSISSVERQTYCKTKGGEWR